MGKYRHLGQAVAEIQAGLPVQLYARGGAAGRGACHLPSGCDSPFRLRPNDAVPSRLSALLAALLFAASGAAQAKTIAALSPSLFDVNKAIGSAADGDTGCTRRNSDLDRSTCYYQGYHVNGTNHD